MDEPQSLTFKLLHQEGDARTGLLSTQHGDIQLPGLLLYSRTGTPPNLTPDLMVPITQLRAVQVCLQHFYKEKEVLKAFGKGIHEFLSLKDKILFLSLRDPAEYTEISVSEGFMNISTISGRQKVTPKEFMETIEYFQADFNECISVDCPHYIKTKRMRKSVDISLKWLDECIQLNTRNRNIFGVIQGGSDISLRTRSATETAKRKVAGFVLGSFGLGESREERVPLLKAVIKELPKDKVRILPGLGSPEEVLDCVEQGIDLFNTNYPNVNTEWGFALTFPLSFPAEKVLFKLNLRDKSFQLDETPISSTCKCHTCQHHTRAYIHHLLSIHEMLATVLLSIHNCYHYLEFFRVIREHIANNSFTTFKKDLLQYINLNPSVQPVFKE